MEPHGKLGDPNEQEDPEKKDKDEDDGGVSSDVESMLREMDPE